jgi:hypothetical protein
VAGKDGAGIFYAGAALDSAQPDLRVRARETFVR